MQAEMSRFEAEVEELAAAILRERKASQPSAVKKVEVALMSGEEGRGGLMSGVDDGDAAAFCRRLLEGLEPELEVAEPPRLSSLTLSGVSPRLLLRQRHLQTLTTTSWSSTSRKGPPLQLLPVGLPGVRFYNPNNGPSLNPNNSGKGKDKDKRKGKGLRQQQ
jgi:hypothetical protein